MAEHWLTEELHPFYRKALRFQEKLVDEQSPYQHIEVYQTEFFGKVLVLDGIIQLTEMDNAGYHEAIVHVPMLAVGDPQRVLVVGGGDGGALQQVLRYPCVQEVTICEADERVVEICREHFPLFGDPLSDRRVRLVVQDAFDYLQDTSRRFDVIIADTTDPIGAAERLFTEEFYHRIVRALNPGGAIATQCEQMFFDLDLIREIWRFASPLLKYPAYYHALIPTYPGGGIGFLYLSDVPWTAGLDHPYPPEQMSYLNPEVHRAMFALPEFFKMQLQNGPG